MSHGEINAETAGIAILGRLLGNGSERMSLALARHILRIAFSDEDEAHMSDLAVRNQEGKLSPKERDELIAYANAGCLLGILQSRARKSLKRARKA
jgi:hypothetical protein